MVEKIRKFINDAEETINEGLKALNKERIALIVHEQSYPSLKDEDTGIGSPFSDGAEKLREFLVCLGFNRIQGGPDGQTRETTPSPYQSSMFSKNRQYINLKDLTEKKWDHILPLKNYKQIVDNKPAGDRVFHTYTYNNYANALQEAWDNFKIKIEKSPTAKKLNEKFESFKNNDLNKDWLESDAIFEFLSNEYGTDEFREWKGPYANIDKELLIKLRSENSQDRTEAEKRLNDIKQTAQDKIDCYKFGQFILDTQKKDKEDQRITTICDVQVTYSQRDYWAYQDLFLKDFYLGAPPDFFAKDGQPWDFPVFDPDKIFEKDSKGNIKYDKENNPILGSFGKLVELRFNKIFDENKGGYKG